jgi:hypothetical protein
MEELELTLQEAREAVEYLKRNKQISVKTTNKFSVGTIINWPSYKHEGAENNKQNQGITTNKQQTKSTKAAPNVDLRGPKKAKNNISSSYEKDISLKKEHGSAVPSKEQTLHGSIPAIKVEIGRVCEALVKRKIFAAAHVFANKNMKNGANPRAVLHALVRIFQVKPKGSPWAYGLKVLQVENGNYNEADYRKEHWNPTREEAQRVKDDLGVGEIFGDIP